MIGPAVRPALVRRVSLVGFRSACEILWGREGYDRVVGMLPPDVRERTAGMVPLPEWLPVADLIAWHVAVKQGPGRDEATFIEHVHTTVDQGFGKVKRLMLSMATPQILAGRAPALWRGEYSTGFLEAKSVDEQTVTLTLYDHPYVHDELMQGVIAEVYRYVTSLTRASNVTSSYLATPQDLVITIRWG